MSEEFKAIETQEELDAIIGKRLERERKNTAEKYADYDELKAYKENSELKFADVTRALEEANETIKSHASEVETLNSRIKEFETKDFKRKLAVEVGLDISLADRIAGEDEKAMKEDAEALAKVFKASHSQPLATTEKGVPDEKTEGYKQMLKELGGN